MKDDKRSFRQKAGDFLSGRGFYIALTACVLVIGVSALTLIFTSGIADRTDVKANSNDQASMADFSNKQDDYEDTITLPFITKDENKENGETPEAGDGETAKETAPEETKPETTTKAPADTGDTKPTEAPDEPETVQTMAPSEPLKFMWPVYGDIEVGYFADELVYNKTMMDWRTHSAIDIAASLGTQVMAAAKGTVAEVYEDDLLGTTVVIDHGEGLKSRYSNLAATPTVAAGDSVNMGDVIGSVGNTAIGETGQAIHLHFAMTKDGVSVDPAEYLPAN